MKRIFYPLLVCGLFLPLPVFASVTGPVEVLAGGLGSEVSQFGAGGTTELVAPEGPYVDGEGGIVISDHVNRRVKLYHADGSLAGFFGPPETISVNIPWPEGVAVTGVAGFVAVKSTGKLTFHDASGSVLAVIDTPEGCEVFGVSGGYGVYDIATNQYSSYSPFGEVRQVTAEAPVEVGVYRGSSVVDGKYRHMIVYPDRTYVFDIPQKIIGSFERDESGNLYVSVRASNISSVYRINRCGGNEGRIDIPGTVKSGTGEALADYVARYGEPVLGVDGTVYVSRLTPEGYAVLKWTVNDDPSVSDVCE